MPLPRCKICRHDKAGPGLIQGAIDGWTVGDAIRYAAQFDLVFSEPTWYAHREHAADVAAEQSAAPAVDAIPKSSNTELLEAVRDFAMQEVRRGKIGALKDGLRAVQILESRKGDDAGTNILALLTTGHAPRVQIMDAPIDLDDMEL